MDTKRLREILEKLEFDPTEVSCSRCSGSGWVMDKKGEQVECEDCFATGKITELKVKDIDQAIKEIQELYEPMSEEEIEVIVLRCLEDLEKKALCGSNKDKNIVYKNFYMLRALLLEDIPHALVGKLSTPRLMDWEKVLPQEWSTEYCYPIEPSQYQQGEVDGANKMRAVCLSALKSMSEPNLTNENKYQKALEKIATGNFPINPNSVCYWEKMGLSMQKEAQDVLKSNEPRLMERNDK